MSSLVSTEMGDCLQDTILLFD